MELRVWFFVHVKLISILLSTAMAALQCMNYNIQVAQKSH